MSEDLFSDVAGQTGPAGGGPFGGSAAGGSLADSDRTACRWRFGCGRGRWRSSSGSSTCSPRGLRYVGWRPVSRCRSSCGASRSRQDDGRGGHLAPDRQPARVDRACDVWLA